MYNPAITLGAVAINVNNLSKQKDFYTKQLGLAILSETETSATLGIEHDHTELIILQQVDNERVPTYGLYHVAILLPNRAALGDFLYHALTEQIPLIGASDHGYSEAIYLEDLEGNGIEIYRDRPVSEWDIQGDRIIGVTEPMDAEGVIGSRNQTDVAYRIPMGTTMGHVHLSARNHRKSAQFYEDVFGMGVKFAIPTGSWIASGMYHHHLAMNEWSGKHLLNNQPNYPGLAHFEIYANTAEEFTAIQQKMAQHGVEPTYCSETRVELSDPDNNRVIVINGK